MALVDQHAPVGAKRSDVSGETHVSGATPVDVDETHVGTSSDASTSVTDAVLEEAPRYGIRYDLALLGKAYGRLMRHAGDSLAAGIAFGTLLSIAPLLVVAVALASVIIGDGSAHDHVIDLVRDSFGYRSARLVGEWVDDARAWSGTATAVGVVGFFVGAARLVSIIDGAFDVIFEAPRQELSWRASVRVFLITQATGVGVTVLATVVIVLSIVLRAVSDSALGLVEGTPLTFGVDVLRTLAAFGLLTVALAIVYRTLPPYRLAKTDVLHGAVLTAVLLEATVWIVYLIIDHIDVAAAYGATGAVVAALVWLFVASELFLFGAEITAELAERRRAADAALRARALARAGARPIP